VHDVWPSHNAARKVSPDTARKTDEKETMARRKLTLEKQLRGTKAALRSARTPPQLKEGLLQRKHVLEKAIGKGRKTRRLPAQVRKR